MLHRVFFGLFFLAFPLMLFGQKDSSGVRDRALELFEEYKPEIESSEDLKVKYRTVHIGHLNDDQGLDAVIEFGLGPDKGNKAVERRIAVYMQQAAGLRSVAGIEPDFCPKVDGIQDGSLVVHDMGSCVQPSMKTSYRYRWNGEEMVKED